MQKNQHKRSVNKIITVNSVTNKEITPEGYLINRDVPIARDGEFIYRAYELAFTEKDGIDPNKALRFYRPASCFNESVLESAKNLPFTNDHPNSAIDSDTVTQHIVGVTGENPYFKKGENGQEGILFADKIIVFEKQSVSDIEEYGKKEVSIGFEAIYTLEPIEIDGVMYDGTEEITRFNHLSLVDRGKAGRQFKMHSEHNEEIKMEKTFVKMSFNGIETQLPVEDAFLILQKNNETMFNQLQQQIDAVNTLVKNSMEEKKETDNRVGADEPIEKDKNDTKNEDDKKSETENEDAEEDKKETENADCDTDKVTGNEDEMHEEGYDEEKTDAKNKKHGKNVETNMSEIFDFKAHVQNGEDTGLAAISSQIKNFS